jgi:AcrR family transcriptional regulator
MSASDAPVRAPGTRARSGNAMHRTRAALLAATGECLARYGIRKTTMVDVASRGRVAKATLYNHFRTKDDLLAAYVEDRVTALVVAATGAATSGGISAALAAVAESMAQDPALRRAATQEPALLAPLAVPSQARGWTQAREGAAAVLTAARLTPSEARVEALLRWATSQLLWPAAGDGGAAALLGNAIDVPEQADVPVTAGGAQDVMALTAPVPSVGWPAHA